MSIGCHPRPTRSHIASELVLTLWTNDPAVAARADAAGVDRIGLDLERHGKAQRQHGLGTWISEHREDDLAPVGEALVRADLFARANPVHAGTEAEVHRLVARGVRVLMLPMFETADEVRRFTAAVGGRARVVLLLETAGAADAATEIAALPGVDEVHVGLNDLTLAFGLPNRFDTLGSDRLEQVCGTVRAAGRPLGVGGLGRAGDLALPVAADLVYASLARLGATRALVSRSFLVADEPVEELRSAIRSARDRLRAWRGAEDSALSRARDELLAQAAAAGSW
jgi:2-keto-3-deoxy-L-rhamnonate aldolase RhmA